MAKARKTAPKPFCFILMPFAKEFDDVYTLGIKEACARAGAYCERVEEQIFHEPILDRIYNQIAKADIVIADMSGRNPNVFYEVGYAHAIGKTTVLLTNKADDIPFDLKHFPHLIYSATGLASMRTELTKRIAHYVKNPPSDARNTSMGVDVFLDGVNVAETNAQCSLSNISSGKYGEGEKLNLSFLDAKLRLTVHNTSLDVLSRGDFKLGFIFPNYVAIEKTLTSLTGPIPMSLSEHMFIITEFSRLLPDEFVVSNLDIEIIDTKSRFVGEEIPIMVKVFTLRGSSQFPFKLVLTSFKK
jgi:hypothetical protein